MSDFRKSGICRTSSSAVGPRAPRYSTSTGPLVFTDQPDWGAQLRTYAAGRVGAPAHPIAADGGSQHIVRGCRGPATAAGRAAVTGGRGGGPAPGGGAACARRSRARAEGLRGHALAGHGGRQGRAALALGGGGGGRARSPGRSALEQVFGLCVHV